MHTTSSHRRVSIWSLAYSASLQTARLPGVFLALFLLMAGAKPSYGQDAQPSLQETAEFIVKKLNGHYCKQRTQDEYGGQDSETTKYTAELVDGGLMICVHISRSSRTAEMKVYDSAVIYRRVLVDFSARRFQVKAILAEQLVPTDGGQYARQKYEVNWDGVEWKSQDEFVRDHFKVSTHEGKYMIGSFDSAAHILFEPEEEELAQRLSKAWKHLFTLMGVKDEPF